MRKRMIAGNWKMNTNISEAIDIVSTLVKKLNTNSSVDVVICPPYISLYEVKRIISDTAIKLGAQNMYFEEKGAFTGEIAPDMLQGLCDYVILGHSERRQLFSETDEIVNKKIIIATKKRFIPILCVGENLDENESGMAESVLKRQVMSGLNSIDPRMKFVIAYEPIWAIGTGRAASGKLANKTIKYIRSILADMWNENTANDTQILYGGSVTEKNIGEFINEEEIDGALVGGASLKPNEFINIILKASEL
jgi:triosephosphate isomerase (TIM)